jgi:tRNA (guanine-N1)-methyltransferase
VLLNGNHEEIDRWREENSRQRTLERRKDLLEP